MMGTFLISWEMLDLCPRWRGCVFEASGTLKSRALQKTRKGAAPISHAIQRIQGVAAQEYAAGVFQPHGLGDDVRGHGVHVAMRALER